MKLEKLEAQIAILEAKKAAMLAAQKRQARADETRRKIIVGSLVLRGAERNDSSKQNLYSRLRIELTRPADRKLFGLDEPIAQPVLSVADRSAEAQWQQQEQAA